MCFASDPIEAHEVSGRQNVARHENLSVLLDPRLRYDMPAMFGPSPVPERTYVPRASAFVLSFRTSHDAAESLVPQYFEVPESPLVSVSHMTYRSVDYLGGRDYNEVVISVGASHKGESETIEGAFAVVLWV